MQKRHAVTIEFLHDEALAAKKSGAELFLERDTKRHALGGAQKRVFLADEGATNLLEVDRHDLARIGRTESDLAFFAAGIGVDRGEQRLASQQTLAGAEHLVEKTLLL